MSPLTPRPRGSALSRKQERGPGGEGRFRLLRTAWWWVQEYFGEHDYDRYLADWQARHPELDPSEPGAHGPMSRRAFFDHRLEIKYGGTVQRCC